MPNLINLTGKRYGRWTVIRQLPIGNNSAARWECVCDCGTTREVNGVDLRSGRSRSCGCIRPEQLRTHGLIHTPEYRSWAHMKNRCNNPNNHAYHLYGGRGIRVCDRWVNSFETFLQDMGPQPSPQHSIDRYPDPNGNYEASNCRWATPLEQGRNRSTTVRLSFNGMEKTRSEWSEYFSLPAGVLEWRLKKGWPVEKALTHPVRAKRRTQACR